MRKQGADQDCSGQCPIIVATDRMVSVPLMDRNGAESTLARRTFLTRGALAAAALALAACSAAGFDSATGPTTLSLSVKLTDYASLATVGGVALVTSSGVPLAIVRTGTNTFVTLSRICPHAGGIVNSNGAGNGFTCPIHGARFNSSGTWAGGQRTSGLRAYATSYDSATGTITVG